MLGAMSDDDLLAEQRCPRSLPEWWGSYVDDRELRTDLSENIAVSQSLSCYTRPAQ